MSAAQLIDAYGQRPDKASFQTQYVKPYSNPLQDSILDTVLCDPSACVLIECPSLETSHHDGDYNDTMYIFQPQFIARRGEAGILRCFIWGPLRGSSGLPYRG